MDDVNGREMWLVGQHRTEPRKPWEVQGLFATEAEAVARCESYLWFVMPLRVGEQVPSETTTNPRTYFPKAPEAEA